MASLSRRYHAFLRRHRWAVRLAVIAGFLAIPLFLIYSAVEAFVKMSIEIWRELPDMWYSLRTGLGHRPYP